MGYFTGSELCWVLLLWETISHRGAREIIRPHARSAFRRLISLYESLSRAGAELERAKDSQTQDLTLVKLEAIIVEQLATADDALEDWRDIVPKEVAELRSKLTTARDMEVKK